MGDEKQGGGAQSSDYDPLKVTLPVFDGPLDLLLHLVRKQSLEINELRIADLTEPYLAYLEKMQDLNLDQGGEFLTLAATLIWLKSKSLLPKRLQEEDELDPETVEEMLILRLQEYQKIKDAAFEMGNLDRLGRDMFPRQEAPELKSGPVEQPIFQEISMFALLEAFQKVLTRSESIHSLHVVPEEQRVEDKLEEMLTLLWERKKILFHELFLGDATRAEIIIAFIALLELIRLKAVRFIQVNREGEIECQVTESFASNTQDWKKTVLGSLLGKEVGLIDNDTE
ncbi:MAG: segregation/condensation protein A [Candidatus Aminicenantes bacterium]|nr:segregation/condensation protein A [Candidatus Aminicenantes bacterium]